MPHNLLEQNQKTTLSDHHSNILGLTESERLIIHATTKMAKSITKLAGITEIPRTSLLYMLKKLENRGLVKQIRIGKRTRWKSVIEKPLRSLASAYARSVIDLDINPHMENGVILYSGMPALFSIFENLIHLPKYSRILALQPDNSLRHALRKNKVFEFLRINEAIKRQKFIVEGIVHERSVETVVKELGATSGTKIFNSFIGRLEDYVKIPDEFANVEAEIWFFGGSAYLINWHQEIAIQFTDPHMIGLLNVLFSCVKELGQRYSQNEKMKKYGEAIRRRSDRSTPPNTPR